MRAFCALYSVYLGLEGGGALGDEGREQDAVGGVTGHHPLQRRLGPNGDVDDVLVRSSERPHRREAQAEVLPLETWHCLSARAALYLHRKPSREPTGYEKSRASSK